MQVRRSRFLINRKFQLLFSFYVCSWIFALSLAYPVIIYNLFEFFIKYATVKVADSSVQVLASMKGEILGLLVLLQFVFLLVTFLISLFMSHKIAGPLYKLRVFLQKAREGKLQESLKFRKGDHFPELADDYNAMVKSFRDLTNENVETVTTAIARIENALGKSGAESRGEIEQALAELRSVRGRISL